MGGILLWVAEKKSILVDDSVMNRVEKTSHGEMERYKQKRRKSGRFKQKLVHRKVSHTILHTPSTFLLPEQFF